MNPQILPILVVATALTGSVAIYQILTDLLLRDRSRINERIDAEFLEKQKARAKKSPLFKNLGRSRSEADRLTYWVRFSTMIEQAGMDATPRQVASISGGAALAVGLIALMIRYNPLDLAIGSALGSIVPILVVKRRRDARMEKLRSQLPEAFDLMARVVRAGQTLGQALLAVADEFPQPISGEFAYCCEQQNLGLSAEVAFRDLNRRTGVIELKVFVLAVLIQQQTGGNLAELLTKLAGIVRDRYKLRGMIRSLTAEGKMQGYILAALPPLMLLLLLAINPTYAGAHFKHPKVLLITFGFEVFGALCIRKIVNFDF